MTTKPTPDQLHRLIDEVAALVDEERILDIYVRHACQMAGCEWWWDAKGKPTYFRKGGHSGLSAVLILLSEGG